jgi:hypothetical protein
MADPRSTQYQPYDSFQATPADNISTAACVSGEKQHFMAASVQPSTNNVSSKKSYDSDTKRNDKPAAASSWPLILWGVRYAVIVIVVGITLAIPMVVFRHDQALGDDESLTDRQYRNLIYYLFAWLETTWLSGAAADMLILAFPYLFWLVSRWVGYLAVSRARPD